MPERVQRQRLAGQPGIPDGAVYVGRPSKWGNPIRISPMKTERGVLMYRVHGSPMDRNGGPAFVGMDTARHFAAKHFEWDLLNGRFGDAYPSLEQIRDELRGHDLACWCPPRRVLRSGSLGGYTCHGDVLIDLANYWEA